MAGLGDRQDVREEQEARFDAETTVSRLRLEENIALVDSGRLELPEDVNTLDCAIFRTKVLVHPC